MTAVRSSRLVRRVIVGISATALALILGLSGIMIVTPEGLPKDIKVTQKLQYGLTEKAIEAARKWRFKPATLNGHPVAVQINIQMNFRLY